MLRLPAVDEAWSGAIALYSIIHLTDDERATACWELGRFVRRGGWLLVAFHVNSPDFAAGDVNHLESWFGEPRRSRRPLPGTRRRRPRHRSRRIHGHVDHDPQTLAHVEYPRRRCYLTCQSRWSRTRRD